MPNYTSFLNGFTVDKVGNSFIAGSLGTGGLLIVATTTLTSNNNNMYLVKFNSQGTLQFAVKSLQGSVGVGENVSSDNNGNSYVIGKFSDKIVLPCDSFTSPAVSHCFVAKYSPTGLCVWAKHLESWSFSGGAANSKIKTDENGNSYITGHFINHVTFDNGITVQAHGIYDEDVLLSKLDSNGNCLWARSLGGSSQDLSGPMDVDDFGNTYISGYFSSAPAYFGSNTLTTNNYDYFTAKYDTYGNCIWANYGYSPSVCATNDGYYTNSPWFISKYDSLGSFQWSKAVNGLAYNYAMSSSNDAVYITGADSGTVSFDNHSLTSTNWQMYVTKLSVPAITTNVNEGNYINTFSVYPNPTNDIITVHFTSVEKRTFTITISNTLGQPVYNESPKEISSSFTKQIDLSDLPAVVYFIKVKTGDKFYSNLRIIKE